MKKLLLILLCLPFIGFGQDKVFELEKKFPDLIDAKNVGFSNGKEHKTQPFAYLSNGRLLLFR